MASQHHHSGPLSALPHLPFPLPRLPFPPRHHHIEDHLLALLSHLSYLPSILFDSAHHLQHSLQQALQQHPLLLRLLPPQLYSLGIPQVGGNVRRQNRRLSSYNFAAVLPGDSVAALVVSNGISNFLNIYNTLLIVRLILTWFPDPPRVILNPLSTLCDPYLNIFRGVIPPLGGTLDLSPILAFFVLNIFTNAATALPAELPSGVNGLNTSSSSNMQLQCASKLTWIQKAWLKRQASSQQIQ